MQFDLPWVSDNPIDTVKEILALEGHESTLNIRDVGPLVQFDLQKIGINTVGQLVEYSGSFGHPTILSSAACFCIDILILRALGVNFNFNP